MEKRNNGETVAGKSTEKMQRTDRGTEEQRGKPRKCEVRNTATVIGEKFKDENRRAKKY